MNQILQQDVSTSHHLSVQVSTLYTLQWLCMTWDGALCYDLVVSSAQLLRGRWINWSRITDKPHLVSWSSGKQNSRTSLVGMVLIFSDLSAGMLSSRTVPRRGRRSEVRTIRRYMKCSLVLGSWWPPTSLLSSTVAGTRSLLMETASGPRFSSIPNQFWWSAGGTL